MNVRGATPPLAGQPPRNGSRDSVLCHPSKLGPHPPPATRSASSAAFMIQRSNSCAAALSKSPVVKDAPITPQEARSNYGALLTPHEHKEILAYPEIYFVGFVSKKIQPTGSTTQFDTPDHHYRVAVGDHIAYRYEIRNILGTGAFGQVLRCFDHKSRENVAVKIIVNTKETEKQAKAETSILEMLTKDDPERKSNIVRFQTSFVFRKHVCAVFELLGQSLFDFAKANMFRPYPMKHVKVIGRQVLTALAFTHKHGIVHCDMKPENILLVPGANTNVRVIDFGSACRVGEKHFSYIQSRFYRAPEVILGTQYGQPIDMWSFGCIIGEMICGRPIFCGDSELHQLEHQISVIGKPPDELLAQGSRRNNFFDRDGKLKSSGGKQKRLPPTPLAQLIRCHDEDALDLISRCLRWLPSERITAAEALKHPFFKLDPESKGSTRTCSPRKTPVK